MSKSIIYFFILFYPKYLLLKSFIILFFVISCLCRGESAHDKDEFNLDFLKNDAGVYIEALSMKALLAKVLLNNASIESADLEKVIQLEKVKAAQIPFDFTLFSTYKREEIHTPQNSADYVASGGGTGIPTNPLQPTLASPNIFEQRNHSMSLGISKKMKDGMILELSTNMNVLDNTLNRSKPPAVFQPEWESYSGVSVTVPMLKDAGRDANLAGIRIVNTNAKIADIAWKQNTAELVADAMKRYYDVIYALENLKVKQNSISLARKLLNDTKARKDRGRAAESDVIVADAGLYQRIDESLTAEVLYVDLQNSLKLLYMEESKPQGYFIRVVPIDKMVDEVPDANRTEMLQLALENRYELQQIDQTIKAKSSELQYATNQTKPRLDLVAGTGLKGLGGNGDQSYRAAFEHQGYEWFAGLEFSMPLGGDNRRSPARAARKALDQVYVKQRDLRIQISLEVDTVVSRGKSNIKRLSATRKSREASLKSAESALKKLAQGVGTSFEVLQLQKEYSLARNREIAALTDLNKDIVDLNLVTGQLLEKMDITPVSRLD